MSYDEYHNWFYCHEQLTGVRFPDGSTRAAGFDNFNRQIWAVDERGVAVTNVYDNLDRLVYSQYVPANQLGAVVNTPAAPPAGFAYSTTTNTLIYGGFANLIITNAYDTAGNLICTKDWAGITTNAFDALNRPILTFTHYLSGVTNRVHNTYDIIGNRLRSDYTINGVAHTITNAYDQLDRLVSVTHPQSSISAIYAYNANGKLASNTYWNSSGRVACQINTYDAEQRLVLAAARKYNESLLVQRAFTYNNAQQIIRIEDTHNNHRWDYLYDNRDQLVNEEHNGAVWYNLAYSYDKAQNRTRTARNHGPDSTFSYSFANKLTNITAGSATANHRYAYDSAGNLTNLLSSTATNRFFYNAQNKLVRIEGRGFTNEFAYDSQHRRIGVKLSGTWRYDAHDGNLCIGSVANGLLDRFFVRGAGIAEGTGDIIAEIPDPRNPSPHPYYYISNHRGDTLAVLDYVYNTAARYEYDAYGNVIEKTGSYTPNYTFSTKEYLPAAGLYLYQYRAYDPIAGRWTQRDPIDYSDSQNLYCFCHNNPVNSLDESGDITSVNLNKGPLYDFYKGVGDIEGQKLVLQIHIQDLKNLNELVDAAVKSIETTFDVMTFMKAPQEEALQMALRLTGSKEAADVLMQAREGQTAQDILKKKGKNITTNALKQLLKDALVQKLKVPQKDIDAAENKLRELNGQPPKNSKSAPSFHAAPRR